MPEAQVELQQVNPQVFGLAEPSPSGLRSRSRDRSEDDNDDDEEPMIQEPLTEGQARFSVYVLVFSVGDMLASGAILITAFKYAYRDAGVSLYCLGMQAISHWISSLLLVLRFVGEIQHARSVAGGADQALLCDRRRQQLYREQGLSIAMGLGILISSCALLIKAFRKIHLWDKWYLDHRHHDREVQEISQWLAWVGFALYSIQAIFRIVARVKLMRILLTHAAVASVVSLIFSLVMGIASKEQREWSWKAEPIAAMVLAVVMLIEGIRVVFNYIDDMADRLRDDPRA
mmetsp:Transcript_1232/g.3007  ORF Transcript_1232/g.3007 Transcript_1232/m.3007 type:complete len:288 (-) Transcript_1232:225-1088(-)